VRDGEDVHAPLAAPTYLTHVTAPDFRRGRAAAAALLLHVAAAMVIVAVLHHRDDAQAPDPATVALVIEPSPFVGTGPMVVSKTVVKAARAQESRPAAHVEKAASARANGARASPDRVAARKAAELPLPAPPAPAPPKALLAALAASAPAPPPHLGNNQPAGYGLVADERIIPARPDARVNLPPAYPPEALSHGEQGRVLLSIQVAPSGRASAVNIVASSGYLILDDAARDAVLGWHFLPAAYAGKAVASTLLLPVQFEITQTGGGVQ